MLYNQNINVSDLLRVMFLFVFSFLLSFKGMGQDVVLRKDLDEKSKKWYKEAVREGRKKNFKKGIKLYDKILKKNPTCIDAILNKAGLFHNMKVYDKSIIGFKEAIELAPEYNPLAYFSLAMVYKEINENLTAADYFEIYSKKGKEDRRVERAKKLSAQLRFTHDALANPVDFDPILMDGGVNTSESEYSPVLSIEGDRMIFTRRVRGQEDFFVALMENGKAVRVAEIENLNTPDNEGVHALSADGRVLIFTLCPDRRRDRGFGSCDLYYTRLDSDSWDIALNMGKIINTIHWDAQPSLSSDGNKLFFSSSRPGGTGGHDIWMSTRTDTSGWTIPVNLGEKINSAGDDESPFIHPDGHTLYFRSNGRPGMGGFDIYYSRYNYNKEEWSEPKNLGYPINTKGNEGALSVSLDGQQAFFASTMAYLDEPSKANSDIYSFELYEEARPLPTTYIKAKVIDKETGQPLIADYSINSLNGATTKISGATNNDGHFISGLPTNMEYAFYIEKEGYALFSENYSFEGIQNAIDPILITIELTPVVKEILENDGKVSAPIALDNIFFQSGSSVLLEKSNQEIDRLANNMKSNKSLKIEVHGHTDNVGSEIDNKKLSEDRAISVVNALLDRGVDSSRVTSKGFGEERPVADNDTEEGRSKNRRTEFVIIYE